MSAASPITEISEDMQDFKRMCRYSESDEDTLSVCDSDDYVDAPTESQSKNEFRQGNERSDTLPTFSKVFNQRSHIIDTAMPPFHSVWDDADSKPSKHYRDDKIHQPSNYRYRFGHSQTSLPKLFDESAQRISSPEGRDLLDILAGAREVADRYLNKSNATRIAWQSESDNQQSAPSKGRLPGFESLLAAV